MVGPAQGHLPELGLQMCGFRFPRSPGARVGVLETEGKGPEVGLFLSEVSPRAEGESDSRVGWHLCPGG